MAVTFTTEGAKRIREAVRRVEGTPQNRVGDRSASFEPNTEIWGLIRGGTLEGKYSWIKVRPDPKALLPHFTLTDDAFPWVVEGEMQHESATEVNGFKGVPSNVVVRLSFVGYDREGVPAFVFQYNDPKILISLPPHTHESNTEGGLAFACFHPGTSLPQQPWAI